MVKRLILYLGCLVYLFMASSASFGGGGYVKCEAKQTPRADSTKDVVVVSYTR